MNLELYDVRHIERFLAEGRITQAEYQAYLDGLEDDAEGAEVSAVRFVVSDPSRRPTPGEANGPEEEG